MFKRIRNLWELSKITPIQSNTQFPLGSKSVLFVKEKEFQPATIVDMSPPVDLEEELNKNNNVS